MPKPPTPDPRRKRLSYRAWRRGFREADLILGAFADLHLAVFTPAQLDAFEALLDQPDPDIYDWIKGAPAPAVFDGELLAMLRAFKPAAGGPRGA
jgi:antitoxin CptB